MSRAPPPGRHSKERWPTTWSSGAGRTPPARPANPPEPRNPKRRCAMNYHGNPCWYELGTGDLDAAAGFYGRILGWQVVDSGMEGFDYRLAKSGSDMRSEERRVGKEGRLWWSADHEKTDSII